MNRYIVEYKVKGAIRPLIKGERGPRWEGGNLPISANDKNEARVKAIQRIRLTHADEIQTDTEIIIKNIEKCRRRRR